MLLTNTIFEIKKKFHNNVGLDMISIY